MTIRIDGQTLSPSVLPIGAFLLSGYQARVASPPNGFPSSSTWTARARTSEVDPMISVQSTPSSFVATLTPASDATVELFGSAGAPISSLDLTRQTSSGGYESALRAPASLAYPGYTKPNVVIDQGALIGIEGLRNVVPGADPLRSITAWNAG